MERTASIEAIANRLELLEASTAALHRSVATAEDMRNVAAKLSYVHGTMRRIEELLLAEQVGGS